MSIENTTAIILAGGKGERMYGADKGLVSYDNRRLIEYSLEFALSQCPNVLISCNRNQAEYADLGQPVCTDELENFQGPLAGLAAALPQCKSDWVLLLPCDCPKPPTDLLQRLIDNKPETISCAHDGQRPQYLFALIKRALSEQLQTYLKSGQRSVKSWYAEAGCQYVDFSDQPDSFLNINSLERDEQP